MIEIETILLPIIVTTVLAFFIVMIIWSWISSYLTYRAFQKLNQQMESMATTMERSAQGMRNVIQLMSDCQEEANLLKAETRKLYTEKINLALVKILELEPDAYQNLKILQAQIHAERIKEDPNDPFVNSIDDLNA